MGQAAFEKVKQPINNQLNHVLKAYLKDVISFVISGSVWRETSTRLQIDLFS